jgi:hypothetical protein
MIAGWRGFVVTSIDGRKLPPNRPLSVKFVGDIYVLVLFLLLTVFGPVVLGRRSSVGLLHGFYLSFWWLVVYEVPVVVYVTHLNLWILLQFWLLFITHCVLDVFFYFTDVFFIVRVFTGCWGVTCLCLSSLVVWDYIGAPLMCRVCVTVNATLPALLGIFLFMCAVMGSGGQVLPV